MTCLSLGLRIHLHQPVPLYLHTAYGGITYQSKHKAQKRNIEVSSLHILSLSMHSWFAGGRFPNYKNRLRHSGSHSNKRGSKRVIHVNRRSQNILFQPCCAILNWFDSNCVCSGVCAFSFQLTDLLRWPACLLSHNCTRIVSVSTGPTTWPSPHERSWMWRSCIIW